MAKSTKANGTQAQVVTELPATPAPVVAAALAKLEPTVEYGGIVKPLVSTAQAKEAWEAYQALCREILDDTDYTFYLYSRAADGVENKPAAFGTRKGAEEAAEKCRAAKYKDVEIRLRKKRSAWDKLARFYDLSLPKQDGLLCETSVTEVGEFIVEARLANSFTMIIYQDKATLQIVKASVTIAVTASNGRVTIGEGVCSVAERKKGAEGFAHADHDIPSTAFTRASNRAISRSIGTGEVSAEEVDDAIVVVSTQANDAVPAQANPAAPVAQPPKETTQVSNVKAEADKPPVAVNLQPAKEEKPKPQTTAEAAVTIENSLKSGVPPAMIPPMGGPSTFEPLGVAAKISERLQHAEKYLYGNAATDTRRQSQLIKYAIFLLPATKVDLEAVPGRLNLDKWNTAIRALEAEDRKLRVFMVEGALQNSTKEEFTRWGISSIESVFGKTA
jgi:hypothetical protein